MKSLLLVAVLFSSQVVFAQATGPGNNTHSVNSCKVALVVNHLDDRYLSIAKKLLADKGYEFVSVKDPQSLKMTITAWDTNRVQGGNGARYGIVTIMVYPSEGVVLFRGEPYRTEDIKTRGEGFAKKQLLRSINWKKAIKSAVEDMLSCENGQFSRPGIKNSF